MGGHLVSITNDENDCVCGIRNRRFSVDRIELFASMLPAKAEGGAKRWVTNWVEGCGTDCLPSANSVCKHTWTWVTGERVAYESWAADSPEAAPTVEA